MPFKKGYIPWNKGFKGYHIHSKEWKKKLSQLKKGHPYWGNGSSMRGKHHTEESKRKISQALKGKHLSEEHKRKISRGNKGRKGYWKDKTGENSAHWKGDKCKKRQQRNDSAYIQWVRMVRVRDNNTCQLKDKNCSGYNIVHHIKNWSIYPELKYNINNGITLCQFHHPKKRMEEQNLIPFFEELVLNK